jgi:hypothetical protein
VTANVFYKHSRIKQYPKEGGAAVETVINTPRDPGILSRLEHLNELRDKARACDRRLVDAERIGQGKGKDGFTTRYRLGYIIRLLTTHTCRPTWKTRLEPT